MKIIKEESIFETFMNKGQAGAGRVVVFPQTESKEIIHIPLRKVNHEVWTVCGDSLETDDPRTTICDGDKVIARTGCTAADAVGRLCVIRLYGSEIAIKRVFRDKKKLLRLENGCGKSEIVSETDAEVLGIVEFFMRKA